jgi:hypothetical protein
MQTRSDAPLPKGNLELDKRIFAIAPHKCGSTMFFSYLSEICSIVDIRHVNYPHWAWGINRNMKLCTDPKSDALYARPIVYLGNRESIRLSGTSAELGYRVIRMVRDPRDALVSMYFSFLGSHRPPPGMTPKQLKDLAKAREIKMSTTLIDDYILERALDYLNRLIDIEDFSAQDVLSTVVRYEDYILDKLGLCNRILAFLQDNTTLNLTLEQQQLDEIAKKNDIIPMQEDKSQHIRKALPGDHIEKLQPATIERLNLVFKDFLIMHNYI